METEKNVKLTTEKIVQQLKGNEKQRFQKKGEEYLKKHSPKSLELKPLDWNKLQSQSEILKKFLESLPSANTNQKLIEELLEQSERDKQNLENLRAYIENLQEGLKISHSVVGELSEKMEELRVEANSLEKERNELADIVKTKQGLLDEFKKQRVDLEDIKKQHVELRKTFNTAS